MKNKLMITLITFLVLIPLRLPISILFIHFFEWVIGATTKEAIPINILATNVIMSKMIYNLALSSFLVYNIEIFSREKFGRKATEKSYGTTTDMICYWWIFPIGILLLAFIIIDVISINDIFFK